jgi:hypothetical protein
MGSMIGSFLSEIVENSVWGILCIMFNAMYKLSFGKERKKKSCDLIKY